MTPIWLGTSWKMNKPLSQAMAWCETLAARMPEGCHPAIQPFVIPPFTAIQPVSHFLQTHQLPLLTGAQNMHEADQGAWTGEISAAMLSWDIQNDAPPLMKAMPRLIEKCIAP